MSRSYRQPIEECVVESIISITHYALKVFYWKAAVVAQLSEISLDHVLVCMKATMLNDASNFPARPSSSINCLGDEFGTFT